MERRVLEYIARRMEEDTENRRRRREDGTFMEEGRIERSEQDERGETDTRRYARTTNHGHDNDERRRIGFSSGKGESKSHWSEEEFVGDMEESLYHEVDDIFHYLKIMEKVYKKGYDELASAFYEIANEKFVCAEFLKHQLKKTGHYDANEHKELEHDLEKAKKMFKHI